MSVRSSLGSSLSMLARMPRHLWAMHRSPAAIRELQERRLRDLLTYAKTHSPWHRARLGDVDPSSFRLADLPSLPTMTKADVMDHFDEIVTAPGVTLEAALAHLEQRGPDELLGGTHHVVTSAGTSGRIGVWVYDRSAWQELQAANMRVTLQAHLRDPRGWFEKPRIAVIAASSASHLSTRTAAAFAGPFVELRSFPVTDAFSKIVAGLREMRPTTLTGYPSMLAELAEATLQGKLEIAPRRVLTSAEPLLPEQRAQMEKAWNVVVANVWAASEGGPMGVGCFVEPGMHLNEDLVVFEPVDEDGQPVGPGRTAAGVYITNLFNRALPLVRYELTDPVTLVEGTCACGSSLRRIADIEGRRDEIFDYGGDVRVHTHVIRSKLSLLANMTDYQVFQTPRGVRVILRVHGALDRAALERQLAEALAQQGLLDPQVEVDPEGELVRLPSGKLKRQVPLHFDGFGERAAP